MKDQSLAILYFGSVLVIAAWASIRLVGRGARKSQAIEPTVYALLFLAGGIFASMGRAWGLPNWAKQVIDHFVTPPVLTLLVFTGAFVFLKGLQSRCTPRLAVHMVIGLWLWFLLSLEDRNFAALVLAPDHVAVLLFIAASLAGVVYGLGLAAENDRRRQQNQPVMEAEPHERERIFVWPDLVYIELLAMLAMLGVLLVWALLMPAPLESPADPTWTPNPAKAPWYFVGLQELLVYFDPWLAGVMIPVFIILGLCLIPYADTRPKETGFYGFRHRQFATSVFLSGYILWTILIVIGTFYRGPDWQFYGLYESRSIKKPSVLETRPLSHVIWNINVGTHEAKRMTAWRVLLRESPGVVLLGMLFGGVPVILRMKSIRQYVPQWSRPTHWTMSMLLAFMILIPVKMYLNWLMDINYILWLPEIGINL